MKINKATVFTIIGCVGVVASIAVAWKQGPKIDRIVAEKKEENPDISKVELVKATIKDAAPIVAVGSLTMASIILSNRVSAKEIAALGAALSYVTTHRDILQKKLKEVLPEEVYEKVNQEVKEELIEKKNLHYDGGPSIEDTGYGQVLCLDAYSGRLFWSSYTAVDNAIADFNKKFIRDRNVSLNNFYELLGIEQTHFGHQYGWIHDPDYYDDELDIQATIIDHPRYGELVEIDIYTPPMENWLEL